MEYDVIIGLEIHAELKTKSKMFCACDNDAQGQEANTTVCPICLGHPGTLPSPNRQAIEDCILIGIALNCRVSALSKFDRKNYFYPDLPKGYQISQYDLPFVYDGNLRIDGDEVKITRIHLEEDTGKLMHPAGKSYSLVDLNRAGTPLLEMVTEPVIKSAEEAKKFCQAYQQILRYLDISNADMEKGEMRCEANISLQEKDRWKYVPSDSADAQSGTIEPIGDYQLNPKIEIKNINSFKAVEKAVDYEISRQTKALHEGEKLIQETRGWNENEAKTFSQRIKETSADYRYFPEPDIPPIEIAGAWIEEIKTRLIELPLEKKARFSAEYGFNQADAELLVSDKPLADFTEQVISELRAWANSADVSWDEHAPKLCKLTANWLLSELFKHLKQDSLSIKDLRISAEYFAKLVALVFTNKINSSAGQTILEAMYQKGGDPDDLVQELGLEQMDDTAELEHIIQAVIAKNPVQAEQYRAGKESLLQFFVGQAMAATKGKANPKILIDLLKETLIK
jgi:aspartyl-tRNA(Asn)/glutamyl-tRNA(Gln) amidotransferase subunit B